MSLIRVQNLSDKTKKTILWTIVIIIGSILLFFWFRSFQDKLQSLKGEDILDKINLEGMEPISPPSLEDVSD